MGNPFFTKNSMQILWITRDRKNLPGGTYPIVPLIVDEITW
jgi:hypothetical protein